MPGGQGVWDRDFPLDPYIVKGDPASGLLPLVSEGDPGEPGEPAPGVMAYCFRLCLSTGDDRLPIKPPPDYDPRQFELVARFIEANSDVRVTASNEDADGYVVVDGLQVLPVEVGREERAGERPAGYAK